MKIDNNFFFADCSPDVFEKVVKHLLTLAVFLKGINKDTQRNHKLYIFIYYSGHGVLAMEVDKDGQFKKDEKGNPIFNVQ
jgi:hypothetical protein